MNHLEQLLKEHFLPDKIKEINQLFYKYELFSFFNRILAQHNNKVSVALKTNNRAPIAHISSVTSSILTGVNLKIVKINNANEKRKLQIRISEIGIRIILSLVHKFKQDYLIIYETIIESLETTSDALGFDYSDIKELMGFDQIEMALLTLRGDHIADEIRLIEEIELDCMIWTDKVHLDILLYEIHKKKWIKKKDNFAKLFGNTDPNLEVHWNLKCKYHLAYLLYRLNHKTEHYIIRKGTKSKKVGYFKICENYIRDFSGKKLTKNALRKNSSKINKNPEKYAVIIKDVDDIMQILETDFQKRNGDFSKSPLKSPLIQK